MAFDAYIHYQRRFDILCMHFTMLLPKADGVMSIF